VYWYITWYFFLTKTPNFLFHKPAVRMSELFIDSASADAPPASSIETPTTTIAEVPATTATEEPTKATDNTSVANSVEAPATNGAVNGHHVLPVLPMAEEIPAVPIHPATKLRRIIEDPTGFVFAPGVHDGLSARLALEAGFDTLYMVCLHFKESFKAVL
jgi:hypothetical protein